MESYICESSLEVRKQNFLSVNQEFQAAFNDTAEGTINPYFQ